MLSSRRGAPNIIGIELIGGLETRCFNMLPRERQPNGSGVA